LKRHKQKHAELIDPNRCAVLFEAVRPPERAGGPVPCRFPENLEIITN
jgi:hypothetical protein